MTQSPLPIWASGLDNKTALVTGAGRGLGRACAHALIEAGAHVIAVARTTSELDTLKDECGERLEPWTCDVTSDALLERIETRASLDILVNNAGTNRPQPLFEVSDDALDEMLNLNVRAAELLLEVRHHSIDKSCFCIDLFEAE